MKDKPYYILIEAGFSSILEQEVNKKREEGYAVIGGVQAYVIDGRKEINSNYRPKIPCFVQAMVLDSLAS